jgi:hypothetical protein
VRQLLVLNGKEAGRLSTAKTEAVSCEARARNKLWMFCDVKNRRQAYGLINSETAIIIIIIIIFL